MRSSATGERGGGGGAADAVDAVRHALAGLDDAGVRTVIADGVARLDDEGRLGVADALLAKVGDAAALTVAGEALGRVAANPLAGDVDDAALAVSVERLQRLEATVAGEKLRRVAEMAARGSSRATGDRSPADLLCRLGLTRGEAASQVAAAAALQRLPETRAALARGDIGLGHAAAARARWASWPTRASRWPATRWTGSTGSSLTQPTVPAAGRVRRATVGWSRAAGGGWTGASWVAGSTGSRTRSTTTCSPTASCAPNGCAASR